MSLLLDALKKAALEKQRREQPSQNTAPETETNAHGAASARAEGSNTRTEENSASTEEYKKSIPTLTINEQVVNHANQEEESLEFDNEAINDNYRLVMENDGSVEVTEKTTEKPQEDLIGEPETLVIDEQLIKQSLQDSPQERGAVTHSYSSRKKMKNVPEGVEEKVSDDIDSFVVKEMELEQGVSKKEGPPPVHTSTPLPIIEPVATHNIPPVPTRPTAEHFNIQSGKDALNQLLSRSNQAVKRARKRMIAIYILLTLTSFTLVGLYYYFLSINGEMRQPSVVQSLPDAVVPASDNEFEEASAIVDASVEEGATADMDEGSAQSELESDSVSEVSAAHSMATTAVLGMPQAEPVKTRTIKPKAVMAEPQTQSVSLPAESVIISYQAAVDPMSESISRGYQAYQSGDMVTAERAYREVLAEDPYQPDALLGAAAVAVKLNQHEEALRLYQQRLARAPNDEYAQIGILALTSKSDSNPQFDTELNRLLREYPNAAHLHFLKGSLYASRQQWGAAQLSFFEAWQRNNKNPDYAFNLAIAMDHLQEPKEALRFYQQAISLSSGHAIGFSTDAVQRRIQELEKK